jgi:hypothetical protein
MIHNVLLTLAVYVAGAALAVVLVLIYLAAERVRDAIRNGDPFPRLNRAAETDRITGLLDAIHEQEPAPELATAIIAPSPLIPTRQLATKRAGHYARLDQQARRAAVVTAAGPDTQQFNRIVEGATGRPPRGRGPREADVRPAWEQPDLFAEAAR